MSDAEAIDQQRQLLLAYRRTLVHLLKQAAQFGEPFVPPQVANGIVEAHAQIRALKAGLRASGTAIDDMSIDEPIAMPNESSAPLPANAGGSAANSPSQQISFSGGTNFGVVANTNTGTINNTNTTQTTATSPSVTLDQLLAAVRQACEQAQARGDSDMADDLQAVVLALQAALKAQAEGKIDRRVTKIGEARDALRRIAHGRPALGDLARSLDTLG
jgi:hypothetical protein